MIRKLTPKTHQRNTEWTVEPVSVATRDLGVAELATLLAAAFDRIGALGTEILALRSGGVNH